MRHCSTSTHASARIVATYRYPVRQPGVTKGMVDTCCVFIVSMPKLRSRLSVPREGVRRPSSIAEFSRACDDRHQQHAARVRRQWHPLRRAAGVVAGVEHPSVEQPYKLAALAVIGSHAPGLRRWQVCIEPCRCAWLKPQRRHCLQLSLTADNGFDTRDCTAGRPTTGSTGLPVAGEPLAEASVRLTATLCLVDRAVGPAKCQPRNLPRILSRRSAPPHVGRWSVLHRMPLLAVRATTAGAVRTDNVKSARTVAQALVC